MVIKDALSLRDRLYSIMTTVPYCIVKILLKGSKISVLITHISKKSISKRTQEESFRADR